MSGIAEVLVNLGYQVSGSDVSESAATRRLASLGAQVRIGHHPESIANADVVVVSTAIPAGDPERVAALEHRIPVIPRAEMLGELMRMKFSVAIAGSHGKTSTTSMLGTLLVECGLDPTVVVGGRLGIFGGNAKLGSSDLMVAEADESDGSFLKLFPTVAVVTGIDREHMTHYATMDALHDAFAAFLDRVPFYGCVVACLDDPGVQTLLARLHRRVLTYGFSAQADVQASEVEVQGFTTSFTASTRSGESTRVELQTPGHHQVQNALAALAVAGELGLGLPKAARGLAGFEGAGRRMERKGESAGVLVVDDYGHHPREIEAALKALRSAVGPRRVVVLFQPHRYSRLADLFEDFARCFLDADTLLVSEVYAAGEEPIEGVDAEHLVAAIARRGHRSVRAIGGLDEALDELVDEVQAGDVFLTLGAGSVWRAGEALLERLGENE
jgi:UDP-N-acetylmuramate--alanine ligase